MKTKQIIKCQNSKIHLSDWIISHFPENYEEMSYVEPYCGGASILFQKNKSKIEVINDLDASIIQIYQALRDESKEMIRRLHLCKHCEETFFRSLKKTVFEDYLDGAVNEFIVRRMSRNGLRENFDSKESWESTIKAMPVVSDRLKEVYIFNKPGLDIIKTFNTDDSLVYCDPPYLYETKVSKAVYSSAMTTEDHIELSHALNNFNGKAIISGCPSPLYNRLYKSWNMEKKKTKEKTVEVIWKNY